MPKNKNIVTNQTRIDCERQEEGWTNSLHKKTVANLVGKWTQKEAKTEKQADQQKDRNCFLWEVKRIKQTFPKNWMISNEEYKCERYEKTNQDNANQHQPAEWKTPQ